MKAKLACFLLMVTMAFGIAAAQDRGLTVSGVISDPQGEPVPGVVPAVDVLCLVCDDMDEIF